MNLIKKINKVTLHLFLFIFSFYFFLLFGNIIQIYRFFNKINVKTVD